MASTSTWLWVGAAAVGLILLTRRSSSSSAASSAGGGTVRDHRANGDGAAGEDTAENFVIPSGTKGETQMVTPNNTFGDAPPSIVIPGAASSAPSIVIPPAAPKPAFATATRVDRMRAHDGAGDPEFGAADMPRRGARR